MCSSYHLVVVMRLPLLHNLWLHVLHVSFFPFLRVGGFSLNVWLSICVVVFFELWTATCRRVFCQEWEATLQLMTVGWSSSSGLQMQLLNIGRNTLLLIRDTQDFLACRSFFDCISRHEKNHINKDAFQ